MCAASLPTPAEQKANFFFSRNNFLIDRPYDTHNAIFYLKFE